MALRSLSGRRPPILNGATTLLILSDTKTIDQKGAISALLEVKRQAGSVLWLNPIGQHHWPHVRSIQNFSALCPMVACNTLSALAAACRKLTNS
jgi:uncharacterized protein with von Willebrand factor type A (vWA) domain